MRAARFVKSPSLGAGPDRSAPCTEPGLKLRSHIPARPGKRGLSQKSRGEAFPTKKGIIETWPTVEFRADLVVRQTGATLRPTAPPAREL